jgi:hypothetical protein
MTRNGDPFHRHMDQNVFEPVVIHDAVEPRKYTLKNHQLIWYARALCIVLLIQTLLLFLMAYACWTVSQTASSLRSDVIVMLNPDESGVHIQQTIKNMHAMSEAPMSYVLQDQYAPAIDAATRMFSILTQAHDMIVNRNATGVLFEMLKSSTEDVRDVHELLSRFQAPMTHN